MLATDRALAAFGFPLDPRPYQRNEVNRLGESDPHLNGLWWEVAVGKTLGAMLLTCNLRVLGGHTTVLLVPPIILSQWFRTLQSIKGLKFQLYDGTPVQRRKFHWHPDTAVFLMTHRIFTLDFDLIVNALGNRPLHVLVDEAQHLKNPSSLLYKGVRYIQDISKINGNTLLSGTPVSKVEDSYAYISLLAPGAYRSLNHFKSVHEDEIDFFGKVISWRDTERIQRWMQHNSSKVLKREVLPFLPKMLMHDYRYDLEPKHRKLYERLVEQQLLVTADEGRIIDATVGPRLVQQLQQIVMNYHHFAGTSPETDKTKVNGLEVLRDFYEQIGRRKMLVYCNYKMTIESVVRYLKSHGITALVVNGEVSKPQQQVHIEQFIVDPQVKALVMNPESGGVGVDGLQDVCSSAIFLEFPKTPQLLAQAAGRLERPKSQRYEQLSTRLQDKDEPSTVWVCAANGTVQASRVIHAKKQDSMVQAIHSTYADLKKMLLGYYPEDL